MGGLVREWRQRRRLSQLDLALRAEVSARHLSFVETGRSTPSRELLLHLAQHLDVPLRERNTLLLAAGYAPVYSRSELEADELTPVRHALDKILTGHEPFPAIVVDRLWNLVSANTTALELLTEGVDEDLLAPPVNVLRASLHPQGLARRIENFGEYAAHVVARLDREVAASADPDLVALADGVRCYPGVAGPTSVSVDGLGGQLFVPLVLAGASAGAPRLTFFSTVATFGTPLDITLAELSIEAFFPADATTADVLRDRWPS